jgi:hypothetical protein
MSGFLDADDDPGDADDWQRRTALEGDGIPQEPSGAALRRRAVVRQVMQRTADQIFASLADERRRQDRAAQAQLPGARRLHPCSPIPASR